LKFHKEPNEKQTKLSIRVQSRKFEAKLFNCILFAVVAEGVGNLHTPLDNCHTYWGPVQLQGHKHNFHNPEDIQSIHCYHSTGLDPVESENHPGNQNSLIKISEKSNAAQVYSKYSKLLPVCLLGFGPMKAEHFVHLEVYRLKHAVPPLQSS
jgi:hypothetical protein